MIHLSVMAASFYSYIIPPHLFGSLSASIDESRALIIKTYPSVEPSRLRVKMVSLFNSRGRLHDSCRYIESIEYHSILLRLWSDFVANNNGDRNLSLNALRDELCRGVILERSGGYDPNRQYLLSPEDQAGFKELCDQEAERRSIIVDDNAMPSAIAIDVRPLQQFMQDKLKHFDCSSQ